jgi:hypothetical protein
VLKVILISLLMLGGSPESSLAQTTKCGSATLPPKLQSQLAEHFNGWKVVDVSDLSAEDQEVWSESFAGKCPGYVEGNFTGRPSIAMTMIRYKGANLYQMLIVAEPRVRGYNIETLSGAEMAAVPDVVLKTSPRKYFNAERDHHVTIKFDGIVYTKLEAAATLYYFLNGKFRHLEISE